MKFSRSLWVIVLMLAMVITACAGDNGDDGEVEVNDNTAIDATDVLEDPAGTELGETGTEGGVLLPTDAGAGDLATTDATGSDLMPTDATGGNPGDAGAAGDTTGMGQAISVETPNGTLTLNYPDGWVAETNAEGLITMAETPETLATTSDPTIPLTDSQIRGSVVQILTPDALAGMGLDETASPVDVATNMAATLGGDPSTFGEAAAFTANGREGAIINGTQTQGETATDNLVAVVNEGDAMIVMLFETVEGGTAEYNDEIEAIAGSVEFEPVAGTEG